MADLTGIGDRSVHEMSGLLLSCYLLRVSATEVITVDYIHLFAHCVSTKSGSTVLEIGTQRPLKNSIIRVSDRRSEGSA